MALPMHIEVTTKGVPEMLGKMNLILGADNKMVKYAISNAGRKVKTILKKDLPVYYKTTSGQVGRDTKNPRSANGGMSCIIPIDGRKYTIGGNHLSASGGAHGWNAVRYKGKGYKITTQIVKGEQSVLPKTMSHQGGQPPFRNLGSKLGKATFTRKGKNRFPIESVSALATAQMPTNRAEGTVRTDIEEALFEQVSKYFYKYV